MQPLVQQISIDSSFWPIANYLSYQIIYRKKILNDYVDQFTDSYGKNVNLANRQKGQTLLVLKIFWWESGPKSEYRCVCSFRASISIDYFIISFQGCLFIFIYYFKLSQTF